MNTVSNQTFNKIQAFISCKFPIDDTISRICEMLEPEIQPYISNDVKAGSLPRKLKDKIKQSDCLIAILTEKGNSSFIQNEVGMAYALNKPIFGIYEKSVDASGIQPYLSTFIKFEQSNIANIAKDLSSLKVTIVREISQREVAGGPDVILDQMRTNGVEAIFPDRATAFRTFQSVWERENRIRIVGSSIEGFKRGIGIEAKELIKPKLELDKDSSIHILLTHFSFAKFREGPEREPPGYIENQIKATHQMLSEIKKETKAGDRLQWRFFKGAPTCFMIQAGPFMLLNPYLYMQAAYFNYSMIVKDTYSKFDIYNHYEDYHFKRAWEDENLTSEDPGFESKK